MVIRNPSKAAMPGGKPCPRGVRTGMKVASPAGELDVIITGTKVEGGSVVVEAGVGLWDVKVYLGPGDFKFIISLLFKPDILGLLLKRLFSPGKK
jgi:hypothetical protein